MPIKDNETGTTYFYAFEVNEVLEAAGVEFRKRDQKARYANERQWFVNGEVSKRGDNATVVLFNADGSEAKVCEQNGKIVDSPYYKPSP
jgi:hypothetical protein